MSESIETSSIVSTLTDDNLQKLIDLIEIKVQTADGEQTINLLQKVADSLQYISNLLYLIFVVSVVVLVLYLMWSGLCYFIDDPYDNYKALDTRSYYYD